MLEISLTLVAGFAAYTAYVIAGDEIRANRTQPKTALRQPVSPKSPTKPVAKAPKPVAAASSAKPNPRKPNPVKAKTATDPIASTAKAIMANLTKYGPLTVAKLAKELNADEAALLLATEKLVNDKQVTSIKRGGHPALALYTK